MLGGLSNCALVWAALAGASAPSVPWGRRNVAAEPEPEVAVVVVAVAVVAVRHLAVPADRQRALALRLLAAQAEQGDAV